MPDVKDIENTNPLWEHDLMLTYQLWKFQDPELRKQTLGNIDI